MRVSGNMALMPPIPVLEQLGKPLDVQLRRMRARARTRDTQQTRTAAGAHRPGEQLCLAADLQRVRTRLRLVRRGDVAVAAVVGRDSTFEPARERSIADQAYHQERTTVLDDAGVLPRVGALKAKKIFPASLQYSSSPCVYRMG